MSMMDPPDLAAPLAPAGGPLGMGAAPDVLGVGYASGNPVYTSPDMLSEQWRAIRNANQSWQLPPLPESVQLELMSREEIADAKAMNELLYGLENDVMTKEAAEMRVSDSREYGPEESPIFGITDPKQLPETHSGSQFRKVMNGIGGWAGDRPTIVPGDPSSAVLDITVRAIDEGLLPEDYPISGGWTPRLKEASFELQRRKTNDMMQGARVGAVPPEGILGAIDKWLSPSSLVSAAVALDFLPNAEAISREANGEHWKGALSDWVSSPGNFINPKKMVAALGPIDDVVFPILNSALLLSGVGGVVQFSRVAIAGRAAQGGIRGLQTTQGLNAFTSSVQGMRFMRSGAAAKHAMDINRMAQPGLIAQRLQKGRHLSKIPGAGGVGSAMETWRSFTATQIARRGVQAGMKTGFITTLEAELAPDRQLGWSPWGGNLNNRTAAERLTDFKAWRTTNPLGVTVSALFEPAFTPYTIFRPGQVTRVPRGLWGGFVNKLNATTDNEALTQVFATAAQRSFRSNPERLKTFNKVSKGDPVAGIVYRMTGDVGVTDANLEVTQMKMLWMAATAGIRKNVAATAKALDIKPDDQNYHRNWLAIRRWYDLRLQKFDWDQLDPSDPDHMRQYLVRTSGIFDTMQDGSADMGDILKLRKKNIMQLVDDFEADPDAWWVQAQARLDHHNDLRAGTANDIFSSLEPEDIVESMWQWGDELEADWENFLVAGAYLDNADDLDRAAVAGPLDEIITDWGNSLLGEELMKVMPAADTGVLDITSAPFNSMQRGITDYSKKFTVAKFDTPSKQTALLFRDSVRQLLHHRKAFTKLDLDPYADSFATVGELAEDLESFARRNGTSVSGMSTQLWREWIGNVTALGDFGSDVARGKSGADLRHAGDAIGFMLDAEVPHAAMADEIERQISALNRHPIWKKLHVQTQLVDPKTKVVRASTMSEKMKELETTKELLGVDVQLRPDIAEELKTMGYKAMAGDHFLQFDHLEGIESPLVELKRHYLARRSLGTFLERPNKQLGQLRDQQQRARFAERAIDLKRAGNWDGPGAEIEDIDEFIQFVSPEGAFINDTMKALRSARGMALDAIDTAEELYGHGHIGRFAASAQRANMQFNIYETRMKTLRALLPEDAWGKHSVDVLKGSFGHSRKMPWEYGGLRNIGDQLVAEGWVRQALKYMSIHKMEDMNHLQRLKRTAMGIGSHRDDLDKMRLWRAAGYASLGTVGAIGYQAGEGNDPFGSWESLGTAAAAGMVGGAVTGLGGPGVIGRTTVRAGMGLVGGHVGYNELSDQDPVAGLTGVAVGAFPGFSALRHGAGKTYNLLASRGWGEYAKMFHGYEQIRNLFRFALNPVFEAQRYTEGGVMTGATVVKDADGVSRQLDPTLKPAKALAKRGIPKQTQINRFEAAVRGAGEDWHDGLTMIDARAGEKGIFGFSPMENMAAVYWQLVEDYGMDSKKAVGLAKELFVYGEKPRSGLEQSVNFVFFPFSFQKQYLTRITKFATDPETGDLARAIMIHDSLRLYNELEERTEFHRLLERHAPVLKQLKNVNALAYGVSAGQLGGINRPTIDAALEIPGVGDVLADAYNAFVPVALEIDSRADAENISDIMERALPLWRETEQLAEDLMDQAHVFTSESHLSRYWESDEGYEEHMLLLAQRDEFMERAGTSMTKLARNESPSAQAIYRWFLDEERKIREKYPEYDKKRKKNTMYAIERQEDKRFILGAPEYTAADAAEMTQFGVTQNGQLAMVQFDGLFQRVLDSYGVGERNAHELPVAAQETLRYEATRLASHSPDWIDLYRRFYSRLIGPIEKDVT